VIFAFSIRGKAAARFLYIYALLIVLLLLGYFFRRLLDQEQGSSRRTKGVRDQDI
jgi:hypothetical protein